MKVAKQSLSYRVDKDDTRLKHFDDDMVNIFLALQGRIRFGDGNNGKDGENISGQFQQFTSDGVADTEFSVAHTIGSVPVGALVLWQDKAGSLYQGPTTGTNWDTTDVYFKCDVASVTFKIFLLK